MVNLLVATHAVIGILAIFAFLLVFVELLDSKEKTAKRVKAFALIGTILIFVSWVVGGYYYVTYYGTDVKPLIKEGASPWIHSVVMETKEHVFLFLPFLAILATGMIFSSNAELLKNHKTKLAVLMLCALIILIGLAITGMGFLISTGARYVGAG